MSGDAITPASTRAPTPTPPTHPPPTTTTPHLPPPAPTQSNHPAYTRYRPPPPQIREHTK